MDTIYSYTFTTVSRKGKQAARKKRLIGVIGLSTIIFLTNRAPVPVSVPDFYWIRVAVG